MEQKIVIMLFYYERPNLVRNALNSVLKATKNYDNWFLVVHDDGSDTPVGPIVQEILAPIIDKVGIIRSNMTTEDKINSGGMLGLTINQIIEAARKQFNPDIFFLLCDDDEIHPDYLNKLNQFFTQNPNVNSCYSNVICYDPLKETSEGCDQTGKPYFKFSAKLNQWNVPMNGMCKVDASQVAWRASCHDRGAWFPFPAAMDHDARFFNALYETSGPMEYTGFVSQYKGIHAKQLGTVGAYQAWIKKDIDKDVSDDSRRESDCEADTGGSCVGSQESSGA